MSPAGGEAIAGCAMRGTSAVEGVAGDDFRFEGRANHHIQLEEYLKAAGGGEVAIRKEVLEAGVIGDDRDYKVCAFVRSAPEEHGATTAFEVRKEGDQGIVFAGSLGAGSGHVDLRFAVARMQVADDLETSGVVVSDIEVEPISIQIRPWISAAAAKEQRISRRFDVGEADLA